MSREGTVSPAPDLQDRQALHGREFPTQSSHAVQLCEDHDFLVASVARFIGAGIGAGEPVVVIATAPHREAFTRRLRAHHIDVDAAVAAHRLTFLDAHIALGQIMVGGLPDRDRFITAMSGVLEEAARGHGHIRVYGEMVDILWREGNAEGAIRLEALWNELRQQLSFTLLCAYVFDRQWRESDGALLQQICEAHTDVAFPEASGLREELQGRLLAVDTLLRRTHTLETEVSHRRQAEGRLVRLLSDQTRKGEQSDEWFRLLVESVHDYALFMLDARGFITSWNPGAQRIKGYAAHEIVGQHFSRFYPDDVAQSGKCELELEIASREGRFEEEGWRVRKDGTRFWANVVISRMQDEDGKVVGFAKVTRDLTARRQLQLEQVARASAETERARLFDLFMMVPVPIMLTRGPEHVVELANPAYCEMVGHRARDIVGKPASEAFPEYPANFAHFAVRDSVYRTGERFVSDEYPLALLRNGRSEEVALRLAIEPLKDASGQVYGLMSVATDISDQVRARRMLEWTLAEQKRIDELREQLMGVVGHDLRGPLSSISVTAEWMLKRGTLPEAEVRATARISRSAGRMARMISQLLDFTRSRLGGGMPIMPRPVDLTEVCAEVIAEQETVHPERVFSLDSGGRSEGVWDRDRLTQVVANLVGNAVQHGDPQSPIELRVTHESEGVRLQVRNRGAPIPPDVQASIFEPFRRGRRERGDRTESLGLGLFIVREIVRAHGGEVGVESNETSGTTFTVRLPWKTPQPRVPVAQLGA